MNAARTLYVGLLLVFGCMAASDGKPSGQSAAAGGSAAPQIPAEKQKDPAQQQVIVRQNAFAQQPAPAREPEAPELDPALVPVEEDFRAETERRIDKRSNLEHELERVAREIAKRQ